MNRRTLFSFFAMAPVGVAIALKDVATPKTHRCACGSSTYHMEARTVPAWSLGEPEHVHAMLDHAFNSRYGMHTHSYTQTQARLIYTQEAVPVCSDCGAPWSRKHLHLRSEA